MSDRNQTVDRSLIEEIGDSLAHKEPISGSSDVGPEGTRVIRPYALSFDDVVAASKAACDALSDEDDSLKREVLAHAGNRWSLGVVYALGTSGTLRHAELARELEGVTQRMLTRTLRHLERDGLITRFDHQVLPYRVEYSLTDLGRGLLTGMMPLWSWVIDNAASFRTARTAYDAAEDDSAA